MSDLQTQPNPQSQSLSLFQIERELNELIDLRSSLLENPADEDFDHAALASVDAQIQSYIIREIRKADNIVYAIRALESAASECKAEATRLARRTELLNNTVDRIKDAAKAALEGNGIKEIKTTKNTLRVQGNGGKAPVMIDDTSKLAKSYTIVQVSLPEPFWDAILEAVREDEHIAEALNQQLSKLSNQRIDKEAIASDLSNDVDVDGAHLGDRGTHLRIV